MSWNANIDARVGEAISRCPHFWKPSPYGGYYCLYCPARRSHV